MEVDVEAFFSNATDTDYGKPVNNVERVIHTTLLLIFCCVGIVCDVLIVYTVFRNKTMRTVNNMLLAYWAINDFCFILFMPIGGFVFERLDILRYHSSCFIDATLFFLLNNMVLMCINLFGLIKETQKPAFQIVITVLYTNAGIHLILGLRYCHGLFRTINEFGPYVGFLFLLLSVIIKEIIACIRKRNHQVNPDNQFRWMTSRICIYNWTFIVSMYALCCVVHHILLIIPYMLLSTSFIGSLYLLIYAVRTDENYKICIYKLLKLKTSDYNPNNDDNIARFVNVAAKNESTP